MPSPVGHSFIGLAIGCAGLLPGAATWRGLARQAWHARGGLLLCLALANAPDIDFLFGLRRGNLNFYHQAGTHTVIWIALVSLSVWLLVWSRRHGRSGWGLLFILALTGSHLLADLGGVDHSPPYGLMLAWPFSDHYWTGALKLFPAVAKTTWSDLWRLHNVGVMSVEALLTLPLVAAVLLWKRRRGKEKTEPQKSEVSARSSAGPPDTSVKSRSWGEDKPLFHAPMAGVNRYGMADRPTDYQPSAPGRRPMGS